MTVAYNHASSSLTHLFLEQMFRCDYVRSRKALYDFRHKVALTEMRKTGCPAGWRTTELGHEEIITC